MTSGADTGDKKTELTTQQLDVVRVEESRIGDLIEKRKVILTLIAKHIRPTDLALFGPVYDEGGKLVGGNIHFERAACEQILMWSNAHVVNVRKEKDEITDELGKYIDYEMWGTVRFADGREMEVFGNCSTRSDFYGKAVANEKQPDGTYKKVESYRPLSEVDVPSVKQAAMTNLLNHACVRALGLKAITIDDLRAAGMAVDKIDQVKFGKGERGGSTATPEEKAQRTDIRNWLLEICGGDKVKASAKLEQLTSFPGKDGKQVPGKKSPDELSGRWLATTHQKVREEFERFKKAPAALEGAR